MFREGQTKIATLGEKALGQGMQEKHGEIRTGSAIRGTTTGVLRKGLGTLGAGLVLLLLAYWPMPIDF